LSIFKFVAVGKRNRFSCNRSILQLRSDSNGLRAGQPGFDSEQGQEIFFFTP
jgi:hypothetical protein